MDQQVSCAGAQHGGHRIRSDIHDPCRHALGMCPAACARLGGQGPPRQLWQCQEMALNAGLAREMTELLVAVIFGAQQIAVGEDHPQVTGLQQHRIRQQAAAAAMFEAGTQQEVAVAADHVAGRFAVGVLAQRGADGIAHGLVVVVTDPALEQVAEDVQRIGFVRLAAQELQELRHRPGGAGIKMQVRDEQVAGRAHASNIVQACPKVLPAMVTTRFAPSAACSVSRNIRACFASTIP